MNQEIVLNSTEFLLQITTVILIFVSLLFALFLITMPSKNKIGNCILAAYLIIRAIDSSSLFYHHYIEVPPILEMLRHDIGGFFQPPLLYLFVLSIVYSDFKLKPKHLWHILPFLVSTLILIPRFYVPEFLGKTPTFTKEFEINLIYILATLQRIAYIVAVFLLLTRYRKLLLENYSVIDKSNYNWLLQMNFFVIAIFFIATAKNISKLNQKTLGNLYVDELRLLVVLAMLAFICWLVFKALRAPKVFTGIDSKLQLTVSMVDKETESTDARTTRRIKRLKEFMEVNKPHLNSDLTIKQLSESFEMKPNELSLLINHHLDKNFYEFISEYRIEEAKQMLKNSKLNGLTVLEILYGVGFNSKSSFNTIFKKQTGCTPSEYRKKYREA